MEDNLKTNVTEPIPNTPKEPVAVENTKNNANVKKREQKILEFALYIIGVVLLSICMNKYNADLNTYINEFHFSEESYVGGDAYNFMISAARSAAVMVKSLIFAVLGSSSIIAGLLIRIASKK